MHPPLSPMSWDRATKLLLLFTTLIVTCHVTVHGQSDVFYVKPTDSSPCPNGTTYSQCNTLDWYSHNIDISFKSNTQMVFLKGNHTLDILIQVTRCHNFSMTVEETVSHHHDGQVQPVSWITCTGKNYTGLIFINSSDIRMSYLGFDSCSGQHRLDGNFTVNFAVAFNNVDDLTLNGVVISNTIGYGLHCEKVFGQVNVTNSVFINAKGGGDDHVYGGNARFWFGNCPNLTKVSIVTITHSLFMYGEKRKLKDNYNINGSGLQIHILCPNIYVHIDSIMAYGNNGINGGNLALSITDRGVNVSKITITNSNISNGHANKGAGLRFWSKIEAGLDGNKMFGDGHTSSINILSISNTTFSNNNVSAIGGAIYIAHYEAENYTGLLLRQIIIHNCTFLENKGNGAAMELLKHTIPGYLQHLTPQLSVHIESCSFRSNSAQTNSSRKLGSIVELIGTQNITLSNSNFINSTGTVISLQNSNINFLGKVRFENNQAEYGGALKVCDRSFLFVHNGTDVLFFNNSAKKGGAIYVQQGCLDTAPACFFQPAVSEEIPIEEFEELFNVTFVNNSAKQAGDAIYGGSIHYCYTFKTRLYEGKRSYFHSKQFYESLIDKTEQSGSSIISSDPQGVCFCNSSNECGIQPYTYELNLTKYPGERFSVIVSNVDQNNGTTTGVINATLNNGQPDDELKSMNSTSIYKGCVNLTYQALTNRIDMKHITFVSLSTSSSAYDEIRNATLFLTLKSCPLGFELNNVKKKCDCNSAIHQDNTKDQVKCHIDTQLIKISENNPLWIGKEKYDGSTENLSLIVNRYCSSDYCNYDQNRTINMFNVTSFEGQCLLGRTGVLCGECKPGLSRILGSFTKCKPCTNRNLLFIIPVILLSGLGLVFVLAFLGITVTEGTLYALVIYANIIYKSHDFSHKHLLERYTKFISWLNMDNGFELCFYNGMDGYQKIWLIYGYMFYLLAIQGVIIYLCHRFVFFTRLFGRNIVKVLATLIFLMYSPLTYAILQTFQATKLHIFTPNGTNKRLVWYYDGNIPYFGTKHIPLFIVAIVCTIVMIWFMLSLLMIQCLRRWSNVFCFRWVEKMRPFFEAYTGPCRDYYQFWPGFIMFMRTVMDIINIVIASFFLSPSQGKLIYVGTASMCVIILTLSCTFPRGVYKKWPLNMLEFSIFLNLLILSVIQLSSVVKTNAPVGTSIAIAMLTFLGILTYHVSVKITKLSVFKRLKMKARLTKLARKIPFKHQIGQCCCPGESHDLDETTPLLAQSLPPVVQYNDYREKLIDETDNES